MTPPASLLRERLAALLAAQATNDGFSPSPLPGVRYARAMRHFPLAPVLYEPSIVLLATGKKRAVCGETVHELDPGHYWVVAAPLAFACESLGSPEAPLYGLSVRVEPAVLGELLLEMDEDTPASVDVAGMCASPMTEEIADAAVRLAACLASPLDARLLGPGIVREIVYRALRGDQGTALRGLAAQNGRLRPIARVLRRIHAEYASPLDVEELAREAHMGLSTFHHAFRAVTASTPLKYLKTVRLHKARAFLAEPGRTAGDAARLAGYASASQFSREYKRLFGASPSEEAARLKGGEG